ncbi:MAG: TolC family protein [Candidatus Omnitrophica bacterium]|nr:TolC family protein [Candidatus Omnitrophota bacterium]
MTKYLKFFIAALLFICFILGNSSAEEVFTWKDCVRQARENHPDLISAREKLNQSHSDKAITKSDALPQINTEISGKRSKTATRDEADTYSYSITGKQLLFDGFKTSADISAASRNLSAQGYNYAVVSSDIRLNLRNAFSTLLRAQELISLTEEIAKRRKQNLELVQLRYEAGREHKGALLTAQADLAQAEFEVAQAKRNLSLAQRQLTKELGRENFSPVKVKGGFEIADTDSEKCDFEYLADNTPFLKELIAKKEAVRFDLESSKADFFPEVYLNTSAGKTASDWPPENDEWSAGITVSFPLFEGGSRIAAFEKAKSKLKQAKADERSGRDTVILTLEQTWKNFQDSKDSVSVKKKFLEAAQERAKIANAQYSTGLISFNDWIIIEDNVVSVKKAYLDTLANLLVAEASWIQAKGGTLDYDG